MEVLELDDSFSTPPQPNGAFVKVPAYRIPVAGEYYAVDTVFGVIVQWVFTDDHVVDHSFRIKTTAEYAVHSGGTVMEKNVTPSIVMLKSRR